METHPRCPWCGGDPLYVAYHDNEWGVPERDSRKLFALLLLEGFQAGLSWITVLRKREHYLKVMDSLAPEKVALYGEAKIKALLSGPGIIRNRLKVNGAIKNARAFLAMEEKGGNFSSFLWDFVGGVSVQNHFSSMDEVPASTSVSDAMAKALKSSGFIFVGSTICYAFMQSCGMVNDHLIGCFRHKEVASLQSSIGHCRKPDF